MKSKKFSKKLSLQKATISNLNENGMNQIKGGLVTQPLTACDVTYCNTMDCTKLVIVCNSRRIC